MVPLVFGFMRGFRAEHLRNPERVFRIEYVHFVVVEEGGGWEWLGLLVVVEVVGRVQWCELPLIIATPLQNSPFHFQKHQRVLLLCRILEVFGGRAGGVWWWIGILDFCSSILIRCVCVLNDLEILKARTSWQIGFSIMNFWNLGIVHILYDLLAAYSILVISPHNSPADTLAAPWVGGLTPEAGLAVATSCFFGAGCRFWLDLVDVAYSDLADFIIRLFLELGFGDFVLWVWVECSLIGELFGNACIE